MSTLFFEGFNISNTNNNVFLDPKYWSRPQSNIGPKYSLNPETVNQGATYDQYLPYQATQGFILLSGVNINSNQNRLQTPIQLSGINNLDSDKIYLGFRARGFIHAPIALTSFPYENKIISFCSGNKEELTVEIVRVVGETYMSWPSEDDGLGLRIKQSGNILGTFDLRSDVGNYYITPPTNANNSTLTLCYQTNQQGFTSQRFNHFEFLIDRTNKNNSFLILKLEGIEITINNFGDYNFPINNFYFDNIKFYNLKINETLQTNGVYNYGTICYDDITLINNSGSDPNYWIGNYTRILPYLYTDSPNNYNGRKIASGVLQEWEHYGGANPLSSRDSDGNYIYTNIIDSINSYRPAFFPTFYNINPYVAWTGNMIGGIKISNEIRKTYLDTDFINVFSSGEGLNKEDYFEIGDRHTVNKSSYNIITDFVMKNPITDEVWTTGNLLTPDGNISGIFGVKKL